MYHVFEEILMQVELKYCSHWKAVWKYLIIGKAKCIFKQSYIGKVLFASKAKRIPPRN
jgi:hypothetical protein